MLSLCVYVIDDDVFQADYFVCDWGDDEVQGAYEQSDYEQEGDGDAQCSVLESAPVLEEAHDGVEYVGYAPCDEERGEHVAEFAEQYVYECYDGNSNY